MAVVDGESGFTQLVKLNILDKLIVQGTTTFNGLVTFNADVIYNGDVTFTGTVQFTPGPVGIGTNDDITNGAFLDVRGPVAIIVGTPQLNFTSPALYISGDDDKTGNFIIDYSGNVANKTRSNGISFRRAFTDGDLPDATQYGFIKWFGDFDQTQSTLTAIAEIKIVQVGTPATDENMTGDFVFSTEDGGTTGFQERMRITSTGEVGINTADPEVLLHVAADGKAGNVLPIGAVAIFEKSSVSGEDVSVGIYSGAGDSRSALFLGNSRGSIEFAEFSGLVFNDPKHSLSNMLELRNNGFTVLSINPDEQFVGINTTDAFAEATLHVQISENSVQMNFTGDDIAMFIADVDEDISISTLTSAGQDHNFYMGTKSSTTASSLFYEDSNSEIGLKLNNNKMFRAGSNANSGFDIGLSASTVFESLPIGGSAVTVGSAAKPGQIIIPRAGSTPTHTDNNFGFPARDAAVHARGTNGLMSDIYLDQGSNTAGASSGLVLRRYRDGVQLVAGDRVGHITAVINNQTDFFTSGIIEYSADATQSSTSTPGYWDFYTTPNTTTTAQKRMRISAFGYVGIGTLTTDPKSPLHVREGSAGGTIDPVDRSRIAVESSGDTFIELIASEGNDAGISIQHSGLTDFAGMYRNEIKGALVLRSGDEDRLECQEDGVVNMTFGLLAVGPNAIGSTKMSLECQLTDTSLAIPVVTTNTTRNTISAANSTRGGQIVWNSAEHRLEYWNDLTQKWRLINSQDAGGNP